MKKIGLIIVFILAFAIRFWQIGIVPPSLDADEVAYGYNAYSILKTGKDEYGKPFPLLFRSFDDYKLPVNTYATIPSVALFGLTDVAVRFPSALFGALTVLFTYFLVKELFLRTKNQELITKNLPTITALLLAVSPWHVLFSRRAHDGNPALFFIVLGSFLFLKGLQKGRYLIFSSVCFVLSIWSYHSSRIFVPLLLLGFVIIFFKELKRVKWQALASFVLGILCIIPMALISFSPEGLMRAQGVSVFQDKDLIKESVAWIGVDTETFGQKWQTVSSIIHNRRLEYVRVFLKGYFVHFNPAYLFSDVADKRYLAPGMGLLYIWEIPFLIIGFMWLAKTKGKGKFVAFWWFFIAPIAAAPTQQIPHPGRTLVFLPMFQLFSAAGILAIFAWLSSYRGFGKIMAYIGIVGIGSVSVFYFLHQYFVHLPIEFSKEWQYGRKQVVESVVSVKKDYKSVVVSTSLDVPYIFFLYYLKYDPALYQKQGGTVSGGFREDKNAFDMYSFRPIRKCFETPDDSVLFVGTPSEMPEESEVISLIHYKDGSPAFVVFKQPHASKTCDDMKQRLGL